MKINDKIVELSIDEITLYEGSHNTDAAVEMIKESLSKFGIQQPIVVDGNRNIVAGNAIYRAAKEIGMTKVPCLILENLTDDEIAQYRIADNKTSEFAKWNESKLKKELSYLQEPTSLQFCFDESIISLLGVAPVKIEMPARDSAKPEKPAPTEKEKDERFREQLKEVDRSLEAKSRKYMDYVCSKCNKKVTIKL